MAIETRTVQGIELGYDTVKKAYFALPQKAASTLSKNTKAELLAIAAEKGVEATEDMTKAQIIEKLEGAE